MINGHDAVIGVLIEQRLDLIGRFADGELESATEAETDSVRLFRHDFERGF
jgi:hypothetical protein